MTWEMVKNLAKREGFNEGISVGREAGLVQGARENAR